MRIVTFGCGLALFWLAQTAFSAEVCINEIMYDAFGADADAEWVEIVNPSKFRVNLENWRFWDGSNHQIKVVRGDFIVEPGEYVVVASSGSKFITNFPLCGADVLDTVMNLKNTACPVALIDSYSNVVESFTYQSAWNNAKEGKSLEKKSVSADPSLPSSWQESASAGGSPGKQNSEEALIQNYPQNYVFPIITEIAPCEQNDFVELLFLEGGCTPLLYLFQGETAVKEMPPKCTLNNEVWVVWFGKNFVDEEVDSNSNGYVEYCSDKASLTSTDNVITLRDSAGTIVDAAIYANNDRTSFMYKSSYELAVLQGMWLPAATGGNIEDYESGSFDYSSGGIGKSINRKKNYYGGYGTPEAAGKNSWFLGRAVTPGFTGTPSEVMHPECLKVIGPNPFNPAGSDQSKKAVQISFKTNSGWIKNMYVFDVGGSQKARIIADDMSEKNGSLSGFEEGVVEWDGYDDSGVLCPSGVYIIYFEAAEPGGGSKMKGKKTCVLAKKLK